MGVDMVRKDEFLPTKASYKRSLIVMLLLLLIYTIQNIPYLSKLMGSLRFNYIFMPLIWVGVALVIWLLPSIRPSGLLKLRSTVNIWAFIFASSYIMLIVISSALDGLGKSPYGHTPLALLTNVIFAGSALIGREFIRSYLINSWIKKEVYFKFILIALLMTWTNISVTRYSGISDISSMVKLVAETIGPEFAQNLFASYLVYLGGPLASIIYLGTIQGFYWLSPVLPDLKWLTTALIGILPPIFFMMAMQKIYYTASKQMRIRERDKENLFSWMMTSVVSIGIIWFAVGVFPTYPSVIVTGSMEPMIKPGDVILVKKITDIEGINNLKIDDVIQFKRGNILISHRIIDIYTDKVEGLGFKTKGDNNSSADQEIVRPKDVKGAIVYTVPKIGWLTLVLKSDKEIELEDIYF